MARLWIDNDGCPQVVRELVLRGAERVKVEVHVVGNAMMKLPYGPLFKMIVVSGAFDAADNHIAEQCGEGDLVITADVPLASRVVQRGALALSPHGELFDAQSIGERLAVRNLMQELRSGGTITGGSAPFGPQDKKRFADALDRQLAKFKSS
jgi:uncharacterized protein YaiI (UPF0178 family)